MEDKIKFGIIGCGNIALGKHKSAFSQTPEALVHAVCDLDEEKAKTAQDKFGAEKVYFDAKEMLASKEIDAVLITTPHPAHAMLTSMAAKAGKHVIVEKPMAVSMEELNTMVDSAKNNNIKLVGLPFFKSESFLKCKKLLEEDYIAHITNIDGTSVNSVFPPEGWYFTPKAGFGATADLGIYSLAPALGIFGKPSELWSANIRAEEMVTIRDGSTHKLEQDDTSKVILKWGKNTIGSITSGWKSGEMRSNLVIRGRKGRLILEGWGCEELYYSPAQRVEEAPIPKDCEKISFLNQDYYILHKDKYGAGKLGLDYLINAIKNDSDLSTDYQTSKEVLQTLTKAYDSVDSGKIINL